MLAAPDLSALCAAGALLVCNEASVCWLLRLRCDERAVARVQKLVRLLNALCAALLVAAAASEGATRAAAHWALYSAVCFLGPVPYVAPGGVSHMAARALRLREAQFWQRDLEAQIWPGHED